MQKKKKKKKKKIENTFFLSETIASENAAINCLS